MARNNEGLLSKINSLCAEDYEKVVSFVNGLVAKTDAKKFLEICSHYDDREPLSMEEIDEEISKVRASEVLREMREYCQNNKPSMTMEEIDEEIQAYRRGE